MISVPALFHQLARGNVIPLRWAWKVAWAKIKRDDVGFFTWDVSQWDGDDILGGDDGNPLQVWDTYAYDDATDRTVSIEVERSIEFPYGCQLAMADVVANNYDGYFTPGSGSTVSDYANQASIPMRLYAGYQTSELVPQFVGLTQGRPEFDDGAKTVSYHALDFLSQIFEMPLGNMLAMRNTTTDEVLRAIFLSFGLTPNQFFLDSGSNKIPFLFFSKDDNTGDVIRRLMASEQGRLWLDEQGIIRFTSRNHLFGDPQLVLDDYQIISIKAGAADNKVNHVKITTPIREVQDYQTVFSKDASAESTQNLWVVSPSLPYTVSLTLDDPCYDVVAPQLGKNVAVSWFTCKTSSGTEVTSGVTVSNIELRPDSYKLTFSNSNPFAVEIDEMELWGTPAKVVDELKYEAMTDDWSEVDDHKLVMQDGEHYMNTYNSARAFSRFVLSRYGAAIPTIEASIKGDFAMQLGDVFTIPSGDFAGDWYITSVKYRLEVGSLVTDITATHHEQIDFFTWDVSAWSGGDVYGF
ncbi:MAG: hypothetical protein LBL84_01720 [Candidatus Nomurabacteria bacterium]|jgi:hypothetical protein|nr:hypothetical protein [Candidatus Nomurabacteria bacterium]